MLATIGLAVWAIRSRRRRGRAWPAAAGAFVAAAAAVALGANAWSGYVPSVGAVYQLLSGGTVKATDTTVAVTAVSIPRPAALHMPAATTWIYTPPGYDAASATRYPVVVMIHGSPGRSADWSIGGDLPHTMDVLIAHGLIQPMIVVMPEMNGFGMNYRDTECLDSNKGGPQVETFLNDVLLPWVDAHYDTAATWHSRAIGGMSAGAFCALDQGLRHPYLYGAIISLEGYGDPGSGGREMLTTRAEFDAHSPSLYVDTMTFPHPVPVFIGVAGKGDASDRRANQALASALEKRGQTVSYVVDPGGHHTWHTARALSPQGLIFASAHLDAKSGA